MESLPSYRRPRTPVTSTASTKTVSPTKSVPAWAAPLEKALAEDTAKVQAPPDISKKTSVPPHLRINENIIAEEDRHDDEALAWKMATMNPGIQHAKQVND
jgi:hypothetical protein